MAVIERRWLSTPASVGQDPWTAPNTNAGPEDTGHHRFQPSLSTGTPMKIDIDQLSEAELIDLNNRIVARLRFLQQMRAHVEMLEFKIGDRVTFRPPGQGPVEGMLTRYNKKTVTVVTDEGRQWNVSPTFLSKAVPPKDKSKSSAGSNVVLLSKR
jgi:hypothetical protein